MTKEEIIYCSCSWVVVGFIWWVYVEIVCSSYADICHCMQILCADVCVCVLLLCVYLLLILLAIFAVIVFLVTVSDFDLICISDLPFDILFDLCS